MLRGRCSPRGAIALNNRQWCMIHQASRRLARLTEKLTCGKPRIDIRKNLSQKIMNYKNAKYSTVIIAGISGLLIALVYVGLEILTENPEATNSISVWHTPLIWLLASIFFYLIFYAVGIVRGGNVKERLIPFSLCVVGAILLALFWVYPMISGLMQCFGGSGC